ncbi:MAG: hypothetical protein KGK44_08635 [Gammaproteobacteria bacterium]|nr:hypothetical protein [Gammaproteobacteria bacterium]
MSVRAWLLLSLLSLGILCLPASADPVNPNMYTNLHWRLLGPFRSGRALAVTGVPGQPNHFYFGAVDGGVWETHDAGRTWTPIFDQQPVGSIGAIAVAASDPKVVYVGTGEADMRSDIAYGDGMYRSSDGGRTWTQIGLTDSQQIGAVLVDPKNPDTVYVAALGHAYGANAERGVFKSTDGGKTWKKVLFKNDNTGAISLAFGGNDQTIFAALWQTRRPPWNVYPPSNGPGSGLYVSHDAGQHWVEIRGHGFPDKGIGRIGIAVSASNPQIVYALVDASQGGLYKSEDGGVHWTRVSDDSRIWERGWYFGGVSVDPKNPETVYVCDTVIYKSTDGGKTFLPMKGDPTGDDYHTLWIDPDNSSHMIAGSDQGVIITLNDGKTWSSWYNQPIAQIYHVTTDNRFPYWVYGAQQDSGAVALPSRTFNNGNGIGMMQFREITAGGESGYLAVDPRHPNLIYGTGYDGGVDRLNTDTGQTQSVNPTLAYPGLYRRVWTMPLVFSPKDPSALYFGNQRIFRTTDGGQHWVAISPDLSNPDPGIPANLDAFTAVDSAVKGPRRGVVYSIAPSPRKADFIWAGTDDGLVWVTNDGGKRWVNATPQPLTPWSKVSMIEAGHFSTDTAYMAVDRHRLNDYKPYIYATHDNGKTWKLIVTGIPDGSFVNVVREDPVKPGLLYAGTEKGVYVSFDDGRHWQSLQLNLPVTSVRDIDVHDNDLVIATHGRGFWIMDDMTELRQLDTQLAQGSDGLFTPEPAYRVMPSGFTGTPLPSDEPHATNPPMGAYIDYYLAKPAYTPVTLDIYDYLGNVVRHFSSATPEPKINLAKIHSTPKWIQQPTPLSAAEGVHRFVWDLRYAQPKALQQDGRPAGGLWVVPGKYKVRLSVNGKSYDQTLMVLKDPRVNLTFIGFDRQLKFARQVEQLRVQVAQASHSIHSLLGELRTAKDKVNEKLSVQIAVLMQKLDTLAGIARVNPDNSVGVPPANTRNLRYFSGALADIENAVESADADPSRDARAGFKLQSRALEPVMQQWRQLQLVDLPKMSAALQKAGQSALNY